MHAASRHELTLSIRHLWLYVDEGARPVHRWSHGRAHCVSAEKPANRVAEPGRRMTSDTANIFSTGQLYDKEWQHLVSRHEVDGLGVIAKKSQV